MKSSGTTKSDLKAKMLQLNEESRETEKQIYEECGHGGEALEVYRRLQEALMDFLVEQMDSKKVKKKGIEWSARALLVTFHGRIATIVTSEN